eukprot:496972-Pyramimonas_sp.AAC.3
MHAFSLSVPTLERFEFSVNLSGRESTQGRREFTKLDTYHATFTALNSSLTELNTSTQRFFDYPATLSTRFRGGVSASPGRFWKPCEVPLRSGRRGQPDGIEDPSQRAPEARGGGPRGPIDPRGEPQGPPPCSDDEVPRGEPALPVAAGSAAEHRAHDRHERGMGGGHQRHAQVRSRRRGAACRLVHIRPGPFQLQP